GFKIYVSVDYKFDGVQFESQAECQWFRTGESMRHEDAEGIEDGITYKDFVRKHSVDVNAVSDVVCVSIRIMIDELHHRHEHWLVLKTDASRVQESLPDRLNDAGCRPVEEWFHKGIGGRTETEVLQAVQEGGTIGTAAAA